MPRSPTTGAGRCAWQRRGPRGAWPGHPRGWTLIDHRHDRRPHGRRGPDRPSFGGTAL